MKRLFFILLLFCGTVQAQFPMPFRTPSKLCRSITIDYTKVSTSTHTDFAVLISGTYTYLKTAANGGQVLNASGYDIGFYSDRLMTTKLKWETERYVAATGEVQYWVKIASLSNAANTVIYMGYGNPAITTDQSDATNVWNSNFKGVYHMTDGTTLSVADATSNARNGTVNNSVTAGTGKIDGTSVMSSTNTDAYISTPSVNPTNVTLSAWAKSTGAAGEYDYIVNKNYNGTNVPYSLNIAGGFSASGGMAFFNGTWRLTGIGASAIQGDGIFHHVTGTYDGTTLRYYVDGTEVANLAYTGSLPSNSNTTDIGRYANNTAYFRGSLDEVRISDVARSAGWILTEYNNQSSPSTFYTISSPL